MSECGNHHFDQDAQDAIKHGTWGQTEKESRRLLGKYFGILDAVLVDCPQCSPPLGGNNNERRVIGNGNTDDMATDVSGEAELPERSG